MRRRYRPRARMPGVVKLLLLLLLVPILSLLIFEVILGPVFTEIAEAQATRLTTQIINDAVRARGSDLSYDDLIYYEKNSEGRIVLMQPNIARINNFSTMVMEEIQTQLYGKQEEHISIPLGYLLGMRILAGFGPHINLEMVPFGFVEPPVVYDVFEGAGINQTRHRIYIKFLTRVKIIMPFVSRTVEVDYEIPVTEVTIVGEVPQVYLNMDWGVIGDLLKIGKN